MRTKLIRSFGGATAVVGLMLAAIIGSATAASASETCRSDRGAGDFNCFSIDGSGFMQVRIGINIFMSPQDAQAILDCPGQELTAALWGDDLFSDDYLTQIALNRAGVFSGEGTSYLDAEFLDMVDTHTLDEDWDGGDEVHGTVTMHDCRTNRNRTFDTFEIHASFG